MLEVVKEAAIELVVAATENVLVGFSPYMLEFPLSSVSSVSSVSLAFIVEDVGEPVEVVIAPEAASILGVETTSM